MFWTVLLSIIGALCGLFIIVHIIGLITKPKTVFADKPEEQNPFEGKKVEFIKDDSDDYNADGVRGHLVVVGESNEKTGFYAKYIKRVFDLVVSFFGLVILSPLFLVIILAIYFDDPGPIFFTQKRIGKNKRFFKLHKFRSMKMSTPHDKPTHMLENPEQYITKVGKFIRAHSLDEIPQIWDIFIGNMSIVGPRPALWNQYYLTAERDKYGANGIKPGLTGWAQINGRDTLEIPEKAKLDGQYAENQTFAFDCKCFFGTVAKVGNDESVVEGKTKENENQETVTK